MMDQPRRRINPLVVVLGLSAVFFALYLAVMGLLNKSPEPPSSPVAGAIFGAGGDGVGVLEVSGVIMDSKRALKALESLQEKSSVKAIVVRLNSPGGAVGPSQEIYDAIKKSKKPVVASMGTVAASGAYYIAAGTQKIFANPGTLTGSIGVIMEFVNLKKLYEWAKIDRYAIKTGKFKSIGADYREMNDEERQLLQALVDDVLGQFKTAVSEGRKIAMRNLDEIADGRIFTGAQAKKLALVDALGGFQDAVDEAAKLGGISGKPKLIYPDRSRPSLIQFVLDSGEDAEDDEWEGRAQAPRWFKWIAAWMGIPLDERSVTSVQQRVFGLEPGVYWLWTGTP